jgi:hypothetical protein
MSKIGIAVDNLRLHIIRPTLVYLELWSDVAEELLLATAAHESLLGHYLVQVNGPALGLYQIEPATHDDVWQNYLKFRNKLSKKVVQLQTPSINPKNQLVYNFAYSTAIARIIYYRCPKKLPKADDIEGLAQYWKSHYNTFLGKGSIDDFISHYQRFINPQMIKNF